MENKPSLKRLVRRDHTETLLKGFAPLLGPEVSLAVSDAPDHVLESRRPFSPEVAHNLWLAASEADDQDETQVIITSQGAAVPIRLDTQQIGVVMASGPFPPPDQTRAVLTALKQALETLAQAGLERRATAREALERYQEINLLYSLGETLATCLDVNELPERTLTEASQIIHARQGAVLLYDETGELVVAASTGPTEEANTIIAAGYALAEEVARTGKPQIINDFKSYNDVEGERQTRFLVVPLFISERRLGAILLADKARGEIFTAGDEKLLSALAWQATIALENARLFDNVRQQRDEIVTMKSYMDNIFASIASGVITTDTNDIIVTFNRAAETILHIPYQQAVNRPYRQVLSFLHYTPLPSLIEDIRQRRSAHAIQEISPRLPQGDQVHLNLSLSPLQGGDDEILGVAIVVDDITEKRHYERERALVRRYLPPGLVERLPYSAELGLREQRRVTTILFADLRGFTTFSEANPPERVMEVLNNYLTLSEAAVRFNWGIVDKYIGDAILALFNTPLLDLEEHAWHAVRMAWTLKQAIDAYHQYVAPDERLAMGFGICTGIVVVGNVGTEDRMEYTAVGDTVNLARRLQQNAHPGQIIISYETWQRVRERVQVRTLPAMQVKGRQAFTRAYEVIGIQNDR